MRRWYLKGEKGPSEAELQARAERNRLEDALADGRLFREVQSDPPLWGVSWTIANKAWAQLEERIAALELPSGHCGGTGDCCGSPGNCGGGARD